MTVPFSRGTHSRFYADGKRHTVKADGLGDISGVANIWLRRPSRESSGNLAFAFGLKTASGNNGVIDNFFLADGSVTKNPVDQSIQLGDGGVGFILQLQAYRKLAGRASGYLYGWYLLTPREKTGVASPLVPLDMDRECKRLAEVSADFASRASEPRKHKPLLDPAAVWRQWATSQFDPDALDARQIRTLCVSPETATRPEFVKGLQKNSSPLARTSCLMGLVFSYFAKWGEIRQQNEIEALITGALRVYSRRNPLILQYRDNADLLFNSDAANRLGSRAVERREQVKAHLAGFRIGLAANLAVSALSSTARSFRALLSPVSENDGAARLKYAMQDVLVPELPVADFQAAVSGLIVSDWVERHQAIRHELRQYVLHHRQLGDPRLQVKNWSGMDLAATAKFLQWIARESIVFFFNHILPDNSANERRKDFWLEYLGAIKDFQVALSARDYNRLYARSRLTEVPGFGRVDHETTSAFIMRFGVRGGDDDVIIVEFSETGNASHAFSASVFERRAGKLRNSQFNFSKLKHQANEDRILHLGAWEMHARNKLAGWGVRR